MPKFILKDYTASGSPAVVRSSLSRHFTANGMKKTGDSPSGAVIYFRYPSFFFSSRRPLTCISRLSLETVGSGGVVRIRIGATFTKVKYFTVAVMGFLWFGFPIVSGIVQSSMPEFSPFGFLVMPAGVFLHYTLRGRAFRYLRKTVERIGE